MTGGNGADVWVSGGAGNDTVNGGDGADHVFGAAGNDTLNGGNGDDQIHGGLGQDTITCGGGMDTAYVDRTDTVAADCERVPQALGGPASGARASTAWAPRPDWGLSSDDIVTVLELVAQDDSVGLDSELTDGRVERARAGLRP